MSSEIGVESVMAVIDPSKLPTSTIRPLGSLPAITAGGFMMTDGFPAYDVRKFLQETKVVETGDSYLVTHTGHYNINQWANSVHHVLSATDFELLQLGDWIVYDGRKWIRVAAINGAIAATIGDGAIGYQKDDSATKAFIKALFEL